MSVYKRCFATLGVLTLAFTASACAGGPLSQMTKRDISAQVVAARRGLEKCYQTALKDDVDLDGKITLVFIVGAAGQFGTAAVTGVGDQKMKNCMQASLAGMRLSRPAQGPIHVTYPLKLEIEPIP